MAAPGRAADGLLGRVDGAALTRAAPVLLFLLAGLIPVLAPGTSQGPQRPFAPDRSPDLLLLGVVAVQSVPLLLRGVAPVAALAGTAAGLTLSVLGGFVPTIADLAFPFAVYLVARDASRRAARLAVPVVLVPPAAGAVVAADRGVASIPGVVSSVVLLVLLPGAAGLLARRRRRPPERPGPDPGPDRPAPAVSRPAGATATAAERPELPWSLTPREVDVLAGIARGRTNAEISADLGISAETVKTHVSRVIRKVGAQNRTQAAVLGRRGGLHG